MRRPKTTSFYVYYRIATDSITARNKIGALFAEIEARTGIAGTLLARSDDPTTWMETYAPVAHPAAFRRVLGRLAQEHEAAALTTDGRRHVEEFSPLPSRPAQRARPKT